MLARRQAARAFLPFLLAHLLAAQPYLHHQSWTTEDGLPQNTVHQILQTPDGYLWIATEAGLARFDGTTFRTFNHTTDPAFTSDDISSLATTSDGTLWITTTDGILRLTRGHIERTLTLPPTSLPPNPSWSFTGTTVRLTSGPTTRTWSTGLPGARIESLYVDHTGSAWIGTNDGLAALRPDSFIPTLIPSLKGNAVLTTFEDREGNLWIGTETSGLHVLRTLKFRTEPALADKALTTITQTSDGAIWAGTRTDGLRRLQNGLATQPVPSEKLTSPIILSLAPGPHGSLWAGTPDGLNHIDPTGHVRQITSAEGLPDDYIQALLAAPEGALWIGTRQGLVHLNENGCRRSDGFKSDLRLFSCMDTITTANGLSGDLIGALFLSHEGDLWIGTSGGLSRRRPDGSISTQHGLPHAIVTAITQDPTGTLWIATLGHGLTRLSHETLTPVPTSTDRILGLAADTHGSLWLRGEHGIQRLLLADLNRCADTAQPCPAPAAYGLADGLPTTEAATGGSPVLWPMANGELAFATRRGLAITDPTHLPINPIPPPIALERFLVDDTPIDLEASPIAIPPGHVRYTMEFAALSFTVPSEVRYRFKLEGLDQTWTEPTTRHTATYTNLPPGPYTFRVQAGNDDGVWNDQGTTLRFTVIPPVYRRWWFLTLTALAALTLASAIYRLRLHRLQVRFDSVLRERNRVAREIHDTLAQDFVGVSLQLDIVSHLLRNQKVEPALNQVAQTRQLVTEGLADARRSIWELRANLTADSLPARLAKIVERYSTEPLKIRLKIGGAYRKLPQRTEDEILRIAAESLSNIQRHAQATAASVDLAYAADTLTLTVADDGKGFDPQAAAALTGHYGVTGMRERAESIGATLQIQATPGEGATITLTLTALAPLRNTASSVP